jgi:hypothetical protein
VLHDFSNGDNLVHGVAHRSEGHLGGVALSELGEHVGHVVAEGLSLGDAYLVVRGTLSSVLHLTVGVGHLIELLFINNN